MHLEYSFSICDISNIAVDNTSCIVDKTSIIQCYIINSSTTSHIKSFVIGDTPTSQIDSRAATTATIISIHFHGAIIGKGCIHGAQVSVARTIMEHTGIGIRDRSTSDLSIDKYHIIFKELCCSPT